MDVIFNDLCFLIGKGNTRVDVLVKEAISMGFHSIGGRTIVQAVMVWQEP